MALRDPESLKVAVTEALAPAPACTVQAPVPEQAPDHPAKLEFEAGLAFNVTDVPVLKVAVQV